VAVIPQSRRPVEFSGMMSGLCNRSGFCAAGLMCPGEVGNQCLSWVKGGFAKEVI